MDMRSFTSGDYVTLNDLPEGEPPIVDTIRSIGAGQWDKPLLTLASGRKLSLNATNTRVLIGSFGADSESWVGKDIEIYRGELRNQNGGMQPGVRVRATETLADADSL
jgi:hypothetical protein